MSAILRFQTLEEKNAKTVLDITYKVYSQVP